MASLTVAALASESYRRGRLIEPELRFLDPTRAPTVDEAIISYPICYALESREANDVIFLGDSSCADGVDPARLIGFRSYNLGTLARLGPRGSLIILRSYLKAHPKPRLVVLCMGPFGLQVEASSEGARFVDSFGPEFNSPTESAAYFVKRGAQSFYVFADRRNDPLESKEAETFYTFKEKVLASRGFYNLPGEHGEFRDPPPDAKTVHDQWNAGLNELASACESASVPLLVRFAPMLDERRSGVDAAELEKWCWKLEATHHNVTIARPILLEYPRHLMWDAIHLNHAGVDKFTAQLAKDVQSALAGASTAIDIGTTGLR